MKNLGNLSPAKGSNHNKKRLGRGIGSGLGKTAGKGHKGQLQRSGGVSRPGFEGGQTPRYRSMPKRGFVNLFRTHFDIINLVDLNKFEDGKKVDGEALNAAGLLRYGNRPIKLLGKGEINKKITVVVSKASKSARAAIEKAGGKVEEI